MNEALERQKQFEASVEKRPIWLKFRAIRAFLGLDPNMKGCRYCGRMYPRHRMFTRDDKKFFCSEDHFYADVKQRIG